jgi:hypothetical protein
VYDSGCDRIERRMVGRTVCKNEPWMKAVVIFVEELWERDKQ